MSQDKPVSEEAPKSMFEEESGDCFCNKKQCILGIGSIAIGLGGLALSLLL